MCLYVCALVSKYVRSRVQICLYVCVRVILCVCVYWSMYACLHVCVCACLRMCECACVICKYTNIRLYAYLDVEDD